AGSSLISPTRPETAFCWSPIIASRWRGWTGSTALRWPSEASRSSCRSIWPAPPNCGKAPEPAPIFDSARAGHYGARRSGRGPESFGVALPEMSEGEPSDPLARLGQRLDRARARHGEETRTQTGGPALQQGVGLGLRIGIELVV